MLGLTFFSKLDWGSYIISIAKSASKKIRALIHSMKFLSLGNALYHVCIIPVSYTVIMPGLVLLIATWNYWISYKNGYVRLLVLSLGASLEPLAHR